MSWRIVSIVSLALLLAAAFSACGSGEPADPNKVGGDNTTAQRGASSTATTPSALPDKAFRAQISVPGVPPTMRAGQTETISVTVKNLSEVKWPVRGGSEGNKFYVAIGNAWLNVADEKVVTNMDGRLGLPYDLEPGAETEVPLTIRAPEEPGEYVLEVDVVQEQVAWFKDKGSQTFKSRVKVVR